MTGPLCRVDATPAAAEALERLRTGHGDVVLHLAGGAEDAGTPQCFTRGELRIGARDVLLGVVGGVELYEQASQPHTHFRAGWDVHLDVVPGRAPGFSLPPAEGMRFSIRDSRPS